MGGVFSELTFDDAKQFVLERSTEFVWNLFGFAFYGLSADCADGYFTSYDGAPISDITDIHGLPRIVQWQVHRTCDTLYEPLATSGTGPRCCTGSSLFTDARAFDGHDEGESIYGGCEHDRCINYASGRLCETCEHGFEYGSTTSCTTTSGAQCRLCPVDHGFWTDVPGNLDLVTRQDIRGLSGNVGCTSIIPVWDRFSDYTTRGSVSMHRNTIPYSPENAYVGSIVLDSDYSSHVANLQDFTFSLWTCSTGYTGPTCSKVDNAGMCNGGVLNANGLCTCSSEPDVLGNYKYGVYCSHSRTFSETALCSTPTRDQTQLSCAGRGDCDYATGKCTCNHPFLDPETMCVEYYECVNYVRKLDVCMATGHTEAHCKHAIVSDPVPPGEITINMLNPSPNAPAEWCNDGDPATGCSSHDGSQETWLQLDMGTVRSVGFLRIWNRADGYQWRLGVHYIELSDDAVTWTACFYGAWFDDNSAGPSDEPCVGAGRYVRIRQTVVEWFNLGDVQVFTQRPADCDAMKFDTLELGHDQLSKRTFA